VLLLTDGQDKDALSQVSPLVKASLQGASIHCFGFGSDHDAKVLSSIAETAKGTFTYIEAIKTVGEAFASCLGGLLSVVAQSIEVDIEAKTPHKVTKIHSRYTSSLSSNGGANIKLPDLFADEKRDLMISFALPNLTQASNGVQIAVANVSYMDPKHKEKIRLEPISFQIGRPENVKDGGVNPELDVQHNRIATADAIEAAVKQADSDNFAASKNLLQDAMLAVQNSISKNNPLCKELISDLQECMKRTSDRSQFSSGGMAWAKSAQIQHQQQRACVQPSKVSSAYTTSNQQMQQPNYNMQQQSYQKKPHS